MYPNFSGQTFGHYQIQDVLGRGGMAVVYRARQINLDRDVAIKIISPQAMGRADFIARFKREADLIAKLEHPHILPIYDYGQEDNFLYLIVRLMEGGSLDKRIMGKPLPLADIERLMGQITSALDYAHSHEIVHRDMKPNNILLDRFGNAYLMDFGIAKIMGGTKMTATSTLMGTPAYMAPEQWKMEAVDHRADIYSLGVILFEMLTGQVPFDAPTPHQLMYAHLNRETPRPSQVSPGLMPAIDQVILKATAKDPAQRHYSARELAQELTTAIQSQQDDARGDLTPLTMRPMPIPAPPPNTQHDWQAPTHPPSVTPGAHAGGATAVSSSPALTPPPYPAQQKTGRGWLTLGAIVGLLAIVAFAAIFFILNRDDDTTDRVAEVTQTPTPSETSTPTETSTPIPTNTPSPTITATPLPTETSTPSITASPTEAPSLTPIPSATPTSPDTLVPTLNETAIEQTVDALVAQSLTETAIAQPPTVAITTTWTPWPTWTPSMTRTPFPSNTPSPSVLATNTPYFIPASTPEFSRQLCPGNPPSIMFAGIPGRVTFTDGTPTRLRASPGGAIIDNMPEGYEFVVVGGPICDDTYTWWQLETPAGLVGWSAEGEPSRYFIEPRPGYTRPTTRALQISDTNPASEVRAQPSTSSTSIVRLLSGDRVEWNGQLLDADNVTWAIVRTYDGTPGYLRYRPDYVTEVNPYDTTIGIARGRTVIVLPDGDLANLRVQPDTSATRLEVVRQMTTMTVVGGPVYEDYYMWWQYQLNDGTIGWIVDVPGWFEVAD